MFTLREKLWLVAFVLAVFALSAVITALPAIIACRR